MSPGTLALPGLHDRIENARLAARPGEDISKWPTRRAALGEVSDGSADALRDVVVSLNRLGDLDATQGNSTSALAGAE